MARVRFASALLVSIAFVAAPAGAQAPRPPPTVAAKIAVMDTACRVAGGRPAGGAYVFVYDFSGDGVNDYLISEGNYNCAGRPDLFRRGGRAMVEIYVSNAGDAQRLFSESVVGYRILDGRPRTVQVFRDSGTVTLRFDGPTHRFVTGQGSGVASPPPVAQGALDPLAGVGARSAPSGGPAAAAVAAATAASAGSGAPETQAAFSARCRAERLAMDRRLPVNIADSSCKSIWTLAQAAMPAANAILNLGGGAPGPMTQAAVRSAFTGATWGGRVGPGMPASGRLGQWFVALRGRTLIDEVSFEWGKTGDSTPFDVVEALKIKGARVTSVACYGYGATEQNNVYRVDAPGRPPFALSVHNHSAGTASESAQYNVVVDLKGGAPTLASVKRGPDGSEYQARCET